MALFNTYLPPSQRAAMSRRWQGSRWDRTKLALTGSNADGSDNGWGEGLNSLLGPVLGAISTYFTGSYKLGSTVGNFANKGLDSLSNKMLSGTEGQAVQQGETAQNERNRAIIDTIGGAAASAYTSLGGDTFKNKPKSGTRKENKILDDALKGVSGDSIGDFLEDNATSSDFDLSAAISSLGAFSNNKKPSFNANSFDPDSALFKFFAQNQNAMATSLPQQQSAPSQAGQQLSLGQNSSVTGMLGDGIKELDSKKPKNTFESTLQYNMFDGFANGGATVKRQNKMGYSIPRFANKMSASSDEDIKKKTSL